MSEDGEDSSASPESPLESKSQPGAHRVGNHFTISFSPSDSEFGHLSDLQTTPNPFFLLQFFLGNASFLFQGLGEIPLFEVCLNALGISDWFLAPDPARGQGFWQAENGRPRHQIFFPNLVYPVRR